MAANKSVKLNTGAEIPVVGLGTWQSAPGQVEHAVEYALKVANYRLIDTAAAYQNETEVGKGLKASGIPRNEIFLTTKLDNPNHGNAAQALESSLAKLDTTYLDLWLMHWPAPMTRDGSPDRSIDWLDTWKIMEELYKAHPDKIKAIGISNYSVEFLERLLKEATVIPAVNQIEMHPSCPQRDVVDFCTSKGIVLQAYSPLGSAKSPLLTNKVVEKIADRHNVEPANVLISLQANKHNVSVIPKSVTNERILSNFTIINLNAEEIAELDDIDKTSHFRACHPSWTGFGGLGFPDCKDSLTFE